jgi:hypothetical protein
MSVLDQQEKKAFTATDAVAGFLAAAAVVLSVVAMGLFFVLGIDAHPARTAPIAIVLAILAGVMSERYERMSLKAMYFAAFAWAFGMTVAVLTEAPLF